MNKRNLGSISNANDDEYIYYKASASKNFRQAFIRKRHHDKMTQTCAAMEIQRVFRGYRTRCKILDILYQKLSLEAMYHGSRTVVERLKDVALEEEPETLFTNMEAKYLNYVREVIQMHAFPNIPIKALRKNLEPLRIVKFGRMMVQRRAHKPPSKYLRKKYGLQPGEEIETNSFKDFCASEIQHWYRKVLEQRKAFTRQAPKKKKRILTPDVAATIIQTAWRRHIDTQVYKYYRDLINFKQKGEPALMLRCVNPTEAKFMDAAAGIHVKFRLAGERFPPNIYYKIFTHRPVQDLCANAPRDYTQASCKKLMAKDLHNKSDRIPVITDDMSGWYQRKENNGWRLVSDRLIQHIMNDSVTWDTSNKTIDYHHAKLQRRQDVLRKKKQKKIDWMRKLYQEGMLKARVRDKETVHLIEGATLGMMATIEAQGEDAVQDWEVDELLDWTTGLNFEDYWTTWKALGTTQKSDQTVADKFSLKVSGLDPFEISVTKAKEQSASSQKKSQNTPRSSATPTSIQYPQ